MVPKTILKTLVFALPLLVVVFAVLIGGALLARATGDELAAHVLQWIGVGVLLAAIVDLVLLVGALGLNALADRNEQDGSSEP